MSNATEPTPIRQAKKASASRSSRAGVFPSTQVGNAEMFIAEHGADLRAVEGSEDWLVWRGTHWEIDHDRVEVYARLIATTRRIKDAGWALRSESARGLSAVLELARLDKRVRVKPEELDRHRMLLACPNGTVDLTTGELREARREDLITMITPVLYDLGAPAPLWEAFLKRVQPDAEVRAYLARAAGVSVSGETSPQKLFLLHGEGSNGKSVFIDAIMSAMGELAHQAPAEVMMEKQVENGGPTPEISELPGKRLVVVSETKRGKALAEDRVKLLTGFRDIVRSRTLYEKRLSGFRPHLTPWLVTNYLPTIKGRDKGIWRRLTVVPWTEEIPEAEMDEKLPDKLETRELSGILAWMVRGCLDWLKRGGGPAGLAPPEVILKATAQYREDEDPIGPFVAARCVISARAWTMATPLYEAYKEWAIANGHGVLNSTNFGKLLNARGCVVGGESRPGGMRGTWRKGICLREEWRDDPENPDNGGGQGEPDPAPVLPSGPSSSATPPEMVPCRGCGQPSYAITGGLHPTCSDPEEAPPATGQQAAPEPAEPLPLDPEPEPVAEPIAEQPEQPDQDHRPVLSRRINPATQRRQLFVTWSTGRGVDEAGERVELPRSARLDQFLSALPEDAERVIICGALPGGAKGARLVSWSKDDLPDGWSAGDHFLDPGSYAGRWVRPDGRRVELRLLSSWARDSAGSARPEHAREAFDLFRAGLVELFGRHRLKPGEEARDAPERDAVVMGSPASTGRALLHRSLPGGKAFPVLDAEHVELLHRIGRQGRDELLSDCHGPELPGVVGYDMRWSYAALCRMARGSGPATLDNRPDFHGLDRPGWYEIDWQVPAGWDHVALLPTDPERYGGRWVGRKPGDRFTGWASHLELALAKRWGWSFDVRSRLLLDQPKTEPLRTWADKLIELREEWLPAQVDRPAAVVELARNMTRTTLVAAIGALWGVRQRVTHTVSRDEVGAVPDGAEASVSGDWVTWTEDRAAAWGEMVHPEWTAQIWAANRVRLLDAGKAQEGAGALHVPFSRLLGLRTDAVYLTADPGWQERVQGAVGQFRPVEGLPAGPVPTPRTWNELARLKSEG